jgi:hypothetical protein
VPTWFAQLPLALSASVTVGFAVLAAVGGLLVVRRFVLPHLNITEGDGEFAGAMVQAILVFYALAVALVAVGSWQRHSDLDDQISTEAATISTLYREAGLYPEPVRSDVRQQLMLYTQHIIDEAFPAQRRGEVPTGGSDRIAAIQASLGAFEPTTGGQQALHEQALDTFDRMITLRRLRLDAVNGHLSIAMWMFVLAGGGLAVAACYFFRVGDWRLQAVMVGLLATFMAMVVVLIVAFDQPFVGDLRVGPDSFKLVLEAMRTQ